MGTTTATSVVPSLAAGVAAGANSLRWAKATPSSVLPDPEAAGMLARRQSVGVAATLEQRPLPPYIQKRKR